MPAITPSSNMISSPRMQYVVHPGLRVSAMDVHTLHQSPRRLVDLSFTPNTISALVLPESNDTLLAAGGQEAELHLSYYQSTDHSSSTRRPSRRFGRRLWESKYILDHGSINNSVLLTTSVSAAPSNQSSAEPRIGVSNNDCTVRLYDVPLRGANSKRVRRNEESLQEVGVLRLDVPINHCACSALVSTC